MAELNLTDIETKELRLALLKIASGMPVATNQVVKLATEMEAFVTGKKDEAPDA